MRKELFQPTLEGEARLLVLISTFTTERTNLDGRTKLAKLDFFLRYPSYFKRALKIRNPRLKDTNLKISSEETVESKMVRYRYGPWDPSYFALLGSLIGRGLVDPVPTPRGIAYRATDKGKMLAKEISDTEPWSEIAVACKLLKSNFDLSGTSLKEFIYKHFPEVVEAGWGETL